MSTRSRFVSCVLVGALASAFATSSLSCGLSDNTKVDCGYPGVDQASCESKGLSVASFFIL
jgi:hypothetical protein